MVDLHRKIPDQIFFDGQNIGSAPVGASSPTTLKPKSVPVGEGVGGGGGGNGGGYTCIRRCIALFLAELL